MYDCVELEKGQGEQNRKFSMLTANRHLRTRHTIRLQLNVCTKGKCACTDVLNKKKPVKTKFPYCIMLHNVLKLPPRTQHLI